MGIRGTDGIFETRSPDRILFLVRAEHLDYPQYDDGAKPYPDSRQFYHFNFGAAPTPRSHHARDAATAS